MLHNRPEKMNQQQIFIRWISSQARNQARPTDDYLRSGQRFARRIWLPRTVGHGISFLFLAPILLTQPLSGWWWLVLSVYAFIWPHLAWLLADRAANPKAAEQRNLTFDAVMGGVWIAVTGLNALPSILILMMVNMNNMGAGGVKLFLVGLLLQAAACFTTLAIINLPVDITTTPLEMWICLPALLIYPVFFGFVTYRTAINLAERKRRLQLLSTRDGMTGVYNRRHWEHLLHNEFDNCRRYQRVSTLLLIDLDHFKSINDTYGHDVGDEAILAITQHLQLTLRTTDVIGRFGGDEFAVFMTGTSVQSAIAAMHRVHEHLDDYRFDCAPELRVRISVGVAPLTPQMTHYREWLKEADNALYKAKKAGRNRTEVAA